MKNIVIVGGGTSGWLSAAYLVSKLGHEEKDGLRFTLIESSDIPTIGVGEATTPSIRSTLADIGFDEFDFMRMSDATFKHGILFRNWTHTPEDNKKDEYFHPFERPLRAGTDGMENYWLKGLDLHKRPFHDAISIQHQVARAGLSPKTAQDQPYDAPLPYAYHLDAGKLAEALKKAAKTRGVKHIVDTITEIKLEKNGNIGALQLKSGQVVTGDLFIDCSGFSSMLINKLDDSFEDLSKVLFCNAAVTLQVPLKVGEKIKPYTTSTAVENGWIWDIGLNNRRGVGYVYSANHCSQAEAEAELRHYLGLSDDEGIPRLLKFKVGYKKNQWKNNCIAVGLSSGFIEPLESTGIHLVEQAVWALSTLIPRYFNQCPCQDTYNSLMGEHYQHAANFVKYHYLLTKRTDSKFWIENTNSASWTPWLREKISIWENSYPDIYDLQNLHTIFDHASYQYVYFGMEGRPKLGPIGGRRQAFATRIFSRVEDGVNNAICRLPPHDDLLHQINHGPKDNGLDFTINTEKNSKINTSIRNIPSNYKTGI